MKNIKGELKNFQKKILGFYTTKNNIFQRNKILSCSKIPLFKFGIKALILPTNVNISSKIPIFKVNEVPPFEENDIVSITEDGNCSAIWEQNSLHNAFFVTDACNSKCIMCPQITDGKSRYNECFELIKLTNLKKTKSIGITGGEPTLEFEKLLILLKQIAKKSPNKKVHILTNGRLLSNLELVKKLTNIKNIKLSFGIPLYSYIAEEHDLIVGVKGAFEQTIKGLYNLAKYKQIIEIRIVVLKQNYTKLDGLAYYIYRNLPFISKVAIMGMEYHGNAETNYNEIAIDPYDYQEELLKTIKSLIRYNIIADIYNIPLCLTDKRLHEFCRDSISTWKKGFVEECESCTKKEKCSGVFKTSFIHSKNIKAFKE